MLLEITVRCKKTSGKGRIDTKIDKIKDHAFARQTLSTQFHSEQAEATM